MFKLFANPTRLEIMRFLQDKERSVSELSALTKTTALNLAPHLARLRRLKVVHVRRENSQAYYKLTDPSVIEACRVLRKFYKENF